MHWRLIMKQLQTLLSKSVATRAGFLNLGTWTPHSSTIMFSVDRFSVDYQILELLRTTRFSGRFSGNRHSVHCNWGQCSGEGFTRSIKTEWVGCIYKERERDVCNVYIYIYVCYVIYWYMICTMVYWYMYIYIYIYVSINIYRYIYIYIYIYMYHKYIDIH